MRVILSLAGYITTAAPKSPRIPSRLDQVGRLVFQLVQQAGGESLCLPSEFLSGTSGKHPRSAHSLQDDRHVGVLGHASAKGSRVFREGKRY